MIPPARPAVVAFDLGGVLVDVDKGPLRALGTADAVAAAFGGEAHDALTVGAVSGIDFVARAARGLGHPAAVVEAAWASVVRWSVGGPELLSAVGQRVPVHVWSNTDPIHWRALSPRIVGVERVAVSFRLGAAKPEAAFFVRALDGHAPSEVLFLDDRDDNVAAARALGIDAVRVRGVEEARAALVARGVLAP